MTCRSSGPGSDRKQASSHCKLADLNDCLTANSRHSSQGCGANCPASRAFARSSHSSPQKAIFSSGSQDGSPKRLPQLPDLPTIAETVPGYEASWWYGLFAPLGTPPDIITTINTEAQKILVDPSFRAKVLDSNFYKPITGSPEEFARYVKSTSARWKSVMHTATAPRPSK